MTDSVTLIPRSPASTPSPSPSRAVKRLWRAYRADPCGDLSLRAWVRVVASMAVPPGELYAVDVCRAWLAGGRR